ncbi:MAG: cation transporter [Caldimonas sp.]
MSKPATALTVRRVVIIVALLNLAYFGIEFSVALAIGSVSLFADSIDFLEDASLNALVALALAWSMRSRARLGSALALLLLVPGLATIGMAWHKFASPLTPDATLLGATGLGALAVNAGCALLLARVRDHAGSLSRAAFLSARNDVVANVAIIGAGVMTMLAPSAWPDLAVGLGIGLLNADAARVVWRAARAERLAATP